MPLAPFLQEFVAVLYDPIHDLGAQSARPGTIGVQGFQIDQDIHAPAHQVRMRGRMIALADFQAILLAEAVLGGHVPMI